jgi:hypothetical protein
MIVIVGHKGNMGQRYAKILDYLKLEWHGIEIDHHPRVIDIMCAKASHILISTPTNTHFNELCFYASYRKPILCEKPFSNNLKQIDMILNHDHDHQVSMVYQYKYIDNYKDHALGMTEYDYYKHGGDGLIWDCIQIIGLARGPISLKETSPIWKCKINGMAMDIGDMDQAYVEMIKDWLDPNSKKMSHEEIYAVHKKAHDFECNHKDYYWDPGT